MEKPFYTAAHQKGGSVWIQTLLDAANQEDRGLKWTSPPLYTMYFTSAADICHTQNKEMGCCGTTTATTMRGVGAANYKFKGGFSRRLSAW